MHGISESAVVSRTRKLVCERSKFKGTHFYEWCAALALKIFPSGKRDVQAEEEGGVFSSWKRNVSRVESANGGPEVASSEKFKENGFSSPFSPVVLFLLAATIVEPIQETERDSIFGSLWAARSGSGFRDVLEKQIFFSRD